MTQSLFDSGAMFKHLAFPKKTQRKTSFSLSSAVLYINLRQKWFQLYKHDVSLKKQVYKKFHIFLPKTKLTPFTPSMTFTYNFPQSTIKLDIFSVFLENFQCPSISSTHWLIKIKKSPKLCLKMTNWIIDASLSENRILSKKYKTYFYKILQKAYIYDKLSSLCSFIYRAILVQSNSYRKFWKI